MSRVIRYTVISFLFLLVSSFLPGGEIEPAGGEIRQTGEKMGQRDEEIISELKALKEELRSFKKRVLSLEKPQMVEEEPVNSTATKVKSGDLKVGSVAIVRRGDYGGVGEIRVVWKSSPRWVDGVVMVFYALLEKKGDETLLTGRQIFYNVEKSSSHRSIGRVGRKVIRRFGNIKKCRVELHYGDRLIDAKETPPLKVYRDPWGRVVSREKKWWKDKESLPLIGAYLFTQPWQEEAGFLGD